MCCKNNNCSSIEKERKLKDSEAISNISNRQKLEMIRLWNRIINMDDDRITKVIFNWEYDLGLSNWCTSVKQILTECGLQQNYETKNLCNLNSLEIKLSAMNETQWKDNLHKKPKLIFYQKLKNSYSSEKYVTQNLSLSLRSSIAQLRFGVLPLHVETGRFSTKSRDQRVCKICHSDVVEDELHFLFFCEQYHDLRQIMYQKITKQYADFESKGELEKLQILVDCPILLGNYIQKAFSQRQQLLYEKL